MDALFEKVETIAGNAIVKTKTELILEYNEGRTDQWCANEAISTWEELQALAAAKGKEVKPSVDARVVVSSTAEDTQIEQTEANRARLVTPLVFKSLKVSRLEDFSYVEPWLKLAFGMLVCRAKLLTLSIKWSTVLSFP
ncbi:hypothetical protein ACOSP7_021215 [Xanthoceras sorbifolium]